MKASCRLHWLIYRIHDFSFKSISEVMTDDFGVAHYFKTLSIKRQDIHNCFVYVSHIYFKCFFFKLSHKSERFNLHTLFGRIKDFTAQLVTSNKSKVPVNEENE